MDRRAIPPSAKAMALTLGVGLLLAIGVGLAKAIIWLTNGSAWGCLGGMALIAFATFYVMFRMDQR